MKFILFLYILLINFSIMGSGVHNTALKKFSAKEKAYLASVQKVAYSCSYEGSTSLIKKRNDSKFKFAGDANRTPEHSVGFVLIDGTAYMSGSKGKVVELHEIGKNSYLEVIPNAPSVLWNFISSHHSNHLIQMKAFGLDGGVLSFTNSYRCIKATK